MLKTQLAYIAGLMDADGYFTIKRNTYSVRVIKDCVNPTYSERVGIKQINNEAIEIIYNNFGGYYHIEKPSCENGKRLYALEIRNLKAHEFIKQIYPYLIIKKKQASILLELRKEIQKGRKGTHIIQQKDRWGNMASFTKHFISPEQIAFRENLITQLNQINDIRACKFDNSKPY